MGLEIVHRSTSDTYSKLPLRRFRIVDTARAEEAEHVLSRELSHLRIRGTADRSRFRLRMNGAHLGGVMVGFNHFDVHTTIEPGELNDAFILSFGDEVPSLMVADSRSVVMSSTTAAMLSPSCRLLIDRPEGSGVFLVRKTPEALEEHLRTLTESDLREPLRFVRRVDFSSEPGATVLRLVRFVISELEAGGPFSGDSVRRTALQELLLGALLTLPNNHSDVLEADYRGRISPRVVRVAEEFMRARIGDHLSIPDLLAVCGCSRSVFFEAFSRYRNHTPMQFLTERRLEQAHRLLRSGSTRSVTSVARECGFSHLGRFAGMYRARFGETPSESMRNRRSEIDPGSP